MSSDLAQVVSPRNCFGDHVHLESYTTPLSLAPVPIAFPPIACLHIGQSLKDECPDHYPKTSGPHFEFLPAGHQLKMPFILSSRLAFSHQTNFVLSTSVNCTKFLLATFLSAAISDVSFIILLSVV